MTDRELLAARERIEDGRARPSEVRDLARALAATLTRTRLALAEHACPTCLGISHADSCEVPRQQTTPWAVELEDAGEGPLKSQIEAESSDGRLWLRICDPTQERTASDEAIVELDREKALALSAVLLRYLGEPEAE